MILITNDQVNTKIGRLLFKCDSFARLANRVSLVDGIGEK